MTARMVVMTLLGLLGPGLAPVHAQVGDDLNGVWEVVSVIDDGRLLQAKEIRETLIKDLRLTIDGQVLQFSTPHGTTRVKTFVTNAKADPKTIDLTDADKVGNLGIYLQEGDTLVICLNGAEGKARPMGFTSRSGEDTVLITLRRVTGGAKSTLKALTTPTAPPARSEEETRRMLVGTWGHQDDKSIQKITLNADGTFSILTTWKKGLKRVFDSEDRVSGRWTYRDRQVSMTVTAGGDRAKVGQVYSFTITNLQPSEVLYVDNQTGARRIEWRIQ